MGRLYVEEAFAGDSKDMVSCMCTVYACRGPIMALENVLVCVCTYS